MCGRYTLTRGQRIRWRFGVEEFSETNILPQFNICPEQAMPVIVKEETRVLELMHWGLVPYWSNEPKSVAINARIEGILSKPSFREPIRSRRCLVPADGFYEWKREGATKTPYYIRRKDGELFAFAGIYDQWGGVEAGPLTTFAIITTTPNELLSSIHNRMPVILRLDQEALWLETPPAMIEELLKSIEPLSQDELELYPVGSSVNSGRSRGPELVEPL